MVGFEASKERTLSKMDFLAAGCVSGFFSRACVQPLDVVKVRFQLQVEPISGLESSSKYRSCLQAIRCITAEEGFSAFWKGHLSSQLLAVSFSGTQFAAFEIYTYWWSTLLLHNTNNQQPYPLSPLPNFLCGSLAGITGGTITQPLDVLKTRFIAQGEPRTYKNLNDAVVSIMRKDGITGFFRGLSPSLLLIAPQTGLQFSIYKLVNRLVDIFTNDAKESLDRSTPLRVKSIGALQNISAGAIAGMVSKCAVYPMDVAKKRLQVQGFEEARCRFGRLHSSSSLRDCIITMCREEGPSSLFKGLSPSLLKACVSIGVRFGVYEEVCSLLSSHHKGRLLKP
uniref:Mitochondrial thiamine pyrophosphate carrier n=1 Tax=Schistocephalus solidus TaxID=70667 RepID=A0A0X3NHS2_SCHSO